MKHRKQHLLLTGAVALVAALGLTACNGDNSGGMAMNSPSPTEPEPTPQPSDPQPRTTSAVFGDWVQSQFTDDVRASATATPVKVGSIDFEFSYRNNPTAFDDLFAGSSSAGAE